MSWVTLSSLMLNILQFFFGLSKDRRIRKYQEFEYAGHIQVKDQLHILRESEGYALAYTGDLENCGPKLIQVQRVRIKWFGKDESLGASWSRIDGGFYLKPGEPKRIQHTFPSSDMEKLREGLGPELHSSLLVDFVDATGKEDARSISLAKINPDGSIITRWHTDILT